MLGAGSAATEKNPGASPSQHEHLMAFEVGAEDGSIPVIHIRAIATVKDATGKDMGTAEVTFPIGGLEAVVTEEPEPEGPGLSGGDGTLENDAEVIERVAYVIRVTGSGWIPHYAGGSYITDGYNDEVLWVQAGEDPQQKIDDYRERLIGDICEKEVPAIPGLRKRPVIWTSGPKIEGIGPPHRDQYEAYAAHEFENTWAFSKEDGPSLWEIREKHGCN